MRSIKPRDVFLSFFFFPFCVVIFTSWEFVLYPPDLQGERQTRSKKKFTATWFLSRAEHLGKRL